MRKMGALKKINQQGNDETESGFILDGSIAEYIIHVERSRLVEWISDLAI